MIVLDVLADMNSVFNALFFGEGSWLGLMIMLIFIVGLTMTWKYTGVLMLIPTGILATLYLTNGLGWHGFIMIGTEIFLLIYVGMQSKRG